MRKWLQGGVLAIALGVASGAFAQKPTDQPANKPTEKSTEGSWWDSWFGNKPQPEPKKKAPPAPPSRPSMADKALELDRQQNAYLRRLAVCDRLREVARETGNNSLQEEADRLEALAMKVYQKHANQLLGAASGTLLEDDSLSASATLQITSPGGPTDKPSLGASTSEKSPKSLGDSRSASTEGQ